MTIESNFEMWQEFYDNDDFEPFSTNKEGILWLKIKSIARPKLLAEFAKCNSIPLKSKRLTNQFVELYNLLRKNVDHSHLLLDNYLRKKASGTI